MTLPAQHSPLPQLSHISFVFRSLFVLFILLSSKLSLAELQADQKRFRAGVILPLTGPLSIQGVPMKHAMLLAKKTYDHKNSLELTFEDDGFQPKNSVSAASRLLDEKQVQAVFIFGTQQGLAVVPLTEKNGIPLLSINVNRAVVEG